MNSYYCIAITFLDPVPSFHGRRDADEPEWPPSPLRLYQALVASAASRWPGPRFDRIARPALEWLERQPPPTLIAPGHQVGMPKRVAVPNNDMDIVASAWSKRQEPKKQPSELKTLKSVRPTWVLPTDGAPASVHYVWAIPDARETFDGHQEVLSAAARGITHLGWGVDLTAAHSSVLSEDEAARLPGERWRPADRWAPTSFRSPRKGSLTALVARHNAFLNRIEGKVFHPVPSLSTFDMVGYRRASDPEDRGFAAFELMKPEEGVFRAFDTTRQAMMVAAMMRHAAGDEGLAQSLGWPPEKVAGFLLGHGEALGQSHAHVVGPRLAFIPIPSIQPRGGEGSEVIGNIRRAMIAVNGGSRTDDLRQVARLLAGAGLIEERRQLPVAILNPIPSSDRMVERYILPASTWATVTPVVLPGHDDPRQLRRRLATGAGPEDGASDPGGRSTALARLDRRVDDLLRKAIRQAGYPDELARDAEIEYRGVGFWAGTELASNYAVPERLRRFRRLHVRITWRDASGVPLSVPGPICLGGGRFFGLGLFAGERRSG